MFCAFNFIYFLHLKFHSYVVKFNHFQYAGTCAFFRKAYSLHSNLKRNEENGTKPQRNWDSIKCTSHVSDITRIEELQRRGILTYGNDS